MGVLGAFVFAAQMVNFSIPGTGSSGHLGGGLLLAALLGPEAAFLVLASVLGVQALFFADGGLLALGANAVNLGVPTAFVAYPLVFRRVLGAGPPSRARVLAASIAAAVLGLALGASLVAVETALSGVSSLPLRSFLLLLVPVHLAIGVVEGLVTGALLVVLWRARPELALAAPARRRSLRPLVAGLGLAALVTGGALSALASTDPDGLEWAAARIAGGAPAAPASGLHALLARVQAATAVLPGYAVPGADARAGTSASGIVGALLALAVAALAGVALRAVARRGRARAAR
jgi:cobalt/nickel transport system permease protein